jgi:hypothetical protein
MTAGAIASAKVVGPAAAGATLLTPLAPAAPLVGMGAGALAAIVGGVGAGMGYDAVYKSLAKHFDEYDAVLAATELRPGWKFGGEVGMMALSLPVSGVQAARGLMTAKAEAGTRGMLQLAGQASGAGAVTGAAAVPIAATMQGEDFTAGQVAAGAGAGLLMGGFFIQGRRVPDAEVLRVMQKQQAGVGLSKDEAKIYRALEGPMKSLMRRMEADGASMAYGQRPQITPNVTQAGVPGLRTFTAARPTAEYMVQPRLASSATPPPPVAATQPPAAAAAGSGRQPVPAAAARAPEQGELFSVPRQMPPPIEVLRQRIAALDEEVSRMASAELTPQQEERFATALRQKDILETALRQRELDAVRSRPERDPGLVVEPEEPVMPMSAGSRTAGPAVPTGRQAEPMMRATGPAKPADPLADPQGVKPAAAPDWVRGPGESGEGRRLIKGIEQWKPGKKGGVRQIVEFVTRASRAELRRSTSQTTKRHPANYRPQSNVIYTSDPSNPWNFHEAGHAVADLVMSQQPDFFKPFEAELMGLVNAPGSMASAQNYHEGVAEWMRLLMMDPSSVANLQVTGALNAAADTLFPRLGAALRDGSRAVNRWQNAPDLARFQMVNAEMAKPFNVSTVVGALVSMRDAAASTFFGGSNFRRYERNLFRAIARGNTDQLKTHQQVMNALKTQIGLGDPKALKAARAQRKLTDRVLWSYNMVLSVGGETQLAVSGTGPARGLRMLGEDNNFKYFSKETWNELRTKVPSKFIDEFDTAAWAYEALNRYDFFTARARDAKGRGDEAAMNKALSQRQYAGMDWGITPTMLRQIVASAKAKMPFEKWVGEQTEFHHNVLRMKEAAGLLPPGEAKKIIDTRQGQYWPMPRQMEASAVRAGRTPSGDIMTGLAGIRGSQAPYRNVDEVTAARVQQALDSIYHYRLLEADRAAAEVAAQNKDLPKAARDLAGRRYVKLTLPYKVAATLSDAEQKQITRDLLAQFNKAQEQVLGYNPELTEDAVNIAWSFKDLWRTYRPGDMNVVGSFDGKGNRVFYQVNDPELFGTFASQTQLGRMAKFFKWLLQPSMQRSKNVITQATRFALAGNIPGDIINQMMMNPDTIGWIPGGATMVGVMNKFSEKYPQVMMEGLLLSRPERSTNDLVQGVRRSAVMKFLAEAAYVHESKDPTMKVLGTVFNPAFWLYPAWLLGNTINLVSFGRYIAPRSESATREGAAVAVKQRGGTDEEAMAAYWNVTGPFNERPNNAQVALAMNLTMFGNPMLMAAGRATNLLTDPDPVISGGAAAKAMMLIPVLAGGFAVLRFLMMSDEEKEHEKTRGLDERLQRYNFGGFSLRYPYGPEGAMFSFIDNAVMDYLLERPKVEQGRAALLLMKRIMDPGTPAQFMGPQVQALTEAAVNMSFWRQKHIVAPWMTSLPASEQYYASTPEFYKKIGQWMNYSPAKLQYIMQQGVARQVDEVIRFMDRMDSGKPIQENADVPFLGNFFVREPLGLGAQPIKELGDVESKLRLLDSRLDAKGWKTLADPKSPLGALPNENMARLREQLLYLHSLRQGINYMSNKMRPMAELYRRGEMWDDERNMQRMMVIYAQSLIMDNREQIETIDQAVRELDQIEQASPEQRAAEYYMRRF